MQLVFRLAQGKVMVALEGGYNLEAISRSALAVAKVREHSSAVAPQLDGPHVAISPAMIRSSNTRPRR